MEFWPKLRILVTLTIFLMTRVGGELDNDSTKMCDLCHSDELLECNMTDNFLMTTNCELMERVCILALVNSSTEDSYSQQQHVCLLVNSSASPLNNIATVFPMTADSTVNNEQPTEGETIAEHILANTDGLSNVILKTIPIEDLNMPSTMSFVSSTHVELTQNGQEAGNALTTDMSKVLASSSDEMSTIIDPMAIQTSKVTSVGHSTTISSLDHQGDQPTDAVRSPQSDETLGEEHETLMCVSCNSSSNQSCLDKPDQTDTVKCSNGNGCIVKYLDGAIVRGCASSDDVLDCKKPEMTSIKCCHKSKCNKTPWKQCYHCNSKNNPECAMWTNEPNINLIACSNDSDECSIRITETGDTIRECSPMGHNCTDNEVCFRCAAGSCNRGVFPEKRHRCFQCKECVDVQDPKNALPCAQYHPNEQCFQYLTESSKMIRGCVSNVTEMEECQMNQPKCFICSGSGCNNLPLMKDPTLSCSKCNSNDNPNCAWAQPLTAVSKCQNKLLYYLQETCMMTYEPVTQKAVRDCSCDYGMCTSEDTNCKTCSGDRCNRGNLKKQKCIQCCSDRLEESKCSSRAENIPSTECPQEMQMSETKGCFAMTKENVTTRGCIAGLTEDEMKFCTTMGKKHCQLCMEDGCNNMLAPSRGWRNGVSFLALIGVILAII